MNINFDDTTIYKLLIRICKKHSVEPSMSIESENYFKNLLLQYRGPKTKQDLERWINQKLSEDFKSIGKKPKWIQGADWQFTNEFPMTFVGQINISGTKENNPFHDTTSIYIFMTKGKALKTIMQQL